MRVLVGCEESQTVCQAFRKRGFDAWSCDIEPTRGDPEYHIQGDISQVLATHGKWDLIILHPPCTAMAVSGNRHYAGSGERIRAELWTLRLWHDAIEHSDHVALENPVSTCWNHIPRSQYIHPWQFGHGETKKTGLALHNLPDLAPTDIVEGREQRIWKMPPSETRRRDRSKTYQGIADAMADQWGAYIAKT